MASQACSKMKPITNEQHVASLVWGRDTKEKNAINIALWYQRRKLHFMAIDIMRDYFKGIHHG